MKALASALICLVARNNTDTSHCLLSVAQHATLPVIFSSIPPSLSLQSHLVSLLSFYLAFSNVLKAIFPCLASVIFYSPHFSCHFFFPCYPFISILLSLMPSLLFFSRFHLNLFSYISLCFPFSVPFLPAFILYHLSFFGSFSLGGSSHA